MGCSPSFIKKQLSAKVIPSSEEGIETHPRETRIIQEEEEDVYLDDEYDILEEVWQQWPENYQVLEENGAWIAGVSSGGSRNNLELFSSNPQFSLNLGDPDEVAESQRIDNYTAYLREIKEEQKIHLSVCLTQHQSPPLHVAFFIYKKESWSGDRLGPEFFLVVPPSGDTGAFVNWRQVKHEYTLEPGAYIVVAATFRTGAEGSFTLSVTAPKPFTFSLIPQCVEKDTILLTK